MVGKVIDKYDGVLYSSSNLVAGLNTTQFLSNDATKAKITIATSLTFLVGIIQVNSIE